MKEAESLAVEEIEDSDWVCEACEYEGGHDPTKTDYCPNCGECIECCGFDESITRGAVSFGMCGLLGCDSCLTTSTDSAYMPYENFCAICDEQGDVDICEYCHTDADWEDPRYGIRGISYKPHEMKEHDFVPMKPPNTYNRKTGKSLKAEDNDSFSAETFKGIPKSVSDLESLEDVRADKYEMEVNFENEDMVIVSGDELKAIIDDGWYFDSVCSFADAGMSLLFTRNPYHAFKAEIDGEESFSADEDWEAEEERYYLEREEYEAEGHHLMADGSGMMPPSMLWTEEDDDADEDAVTYFTETLISENFLAEYMADASGSSKSRFLKASEVEDLFRKAKGTLVSVTFVKRTNGEVRKMLCRTSVKKGVKGVGLKFNPKNRNLIGVYDFQKVREGADPWKCYRFVPMDAVLSMRVRGQTYTA